MLLCVSAVSYGSDGAPTTKADVAYDVDNHINSLELDFVASSFESVVMYDNTSTSFSDNSYIGDVSMSVDKADAYIDIPICDKANYKYINNYTYNLEKEKEPDSYATSYLNYRNLILNLFISNVEKDSIRDEFYRDKSSKVSFVKLE